MRFILAYVALATVFAFACSSSSSSTPSSTSAAATCDDACAHITSASGQPPPGCASTCAGWSASRRSCVANAATCDAMNGCSQQTTAEADSGPKPNEPQTISCD